MRVRVPPSAPPVESLLALAQELERRDADVAERLARVEARRHELDELRALIAATAALVATLPARWAAQQRDDAGARAARDRALAALGEAGEENVPAAEAALEAAERLVAFAEAQRAGLEAEALRAQADAEVADRRATTLGMEPGADAAEWASRERGALLVEHSSLARERDAVVREASELLGSVLGEPLAATSVAGLRSRLEGAL